MLDLGSGVGRNSIPIAQEIKKTSGKVVCVDLLDSAIEQLERYSKTYQVEDVIVPKKTDIGYFLITKNSYDFIIAVSTLEHIESETLFDQVVERIASGTKVEGINCIIVNSEVEEIELATNKPSEAMFEINLKTEAMIHKLNKLYSGWEVLTQNVKPLEYTIIRGSKEVLLKTNAITYIVRKKMS